MQPFIESNASWLESTGQTTSRFEKAEWNRNDPSVTETDKRAERNRRKSWFPLRPNMDETVSNEGTMVVDYTGSRVVSFLVGILNFVCRGHSTRGECCIILSDVT